MNRIVTLALTFIVLVLGAFIVFTNPIDPLAITIGMFFVSVAILNIAVQIYFPPVPEQNVELKVVEEPTTQEIKKVPVKTEKPKKIAKKRKRK